MKQTTKAHPAGDQGPLVAILARIVRRIVAEEDSQTPAPRLAPQRERIAA